MKIKDRKEGKNKCLHLFQILRSYRNKIETQNTEKVPFS